MATAFADIWVDHTGPHGGLGRRNAATGEIRYDQFTEPKQQVALPGADGDRAEQLLAAATTEVSALIHRLSAQALERVLDRLTINPAAMTIDAWLTPDELNELAAMFVRVNITADLLGRWRIRRRHHDRTRHDQPTDFSRVEKFDEGGRLRPLSPAQAIDYFRGLKPGLKIDLFSFSIPAFEQDAFTLAVTTERKILERVQAVILDRLNTGKALAKTPDVIVEILDRAGIGPVNRSYAEMVTRTNMMESFRTGSWREFSDPDLAEDYPVWRYIGIHDGRERHGDDPHAHKPQPADKPDHLRWFGQYFERQADFFQVRGTEAADVINCRCDFVPVYKTDVTKLLLEGMQPIKNWQEIKAADKYAEDLWMPYVGPRRGHGWQNRRTGHIFYGEKPGSHRHIDRARKQGQPWQTIAKHAGLPVTTLRNRYKALKRMSRYATETLESKDAIRLEWAKRAHEEGIDSHHLHSLAHELIDIDRQGNKPIEDLIVTALQRYPHFKDIPAIAAKGGDHDKVRLIDDAAEELAGDPVFSHLFRNYEGSEDQRLFDIIAAGRPQPMDEDDAYKQAFNILAEQRRYSRRQPAEEAAVPFTEKWAPYTGPKGGKGWRNLATGEILYQAEQPGGADIQPRPQGSSLYRHGSKWAANYRDALHNLNASPTRYSEQFTTELRDKLAAAYDSAVKRRIAAVRAQIIDQHGEQALDGPAWKTFLRATAGMEHRFTQRVHAMADHALAHVRGRDKTPQAVRTFRRGLDEHAAKLSGEAAGHADAFNAAHIALVKDLREHYAKQ